MGRPAGPAGFSDRIAQLRPALGSHGPWTSASQFAKDLGVTKGRYLTWESRGCWPGREALKECLARLASVRRRALNVGALVEWLEFDKGGPPLDGSAPQDEADAETARPETTVRQHARELALRAATFKLVPRSPELVEETLDGLAAAVLLLDAPREEQMTQLNKQKWLQVEKTAS